MTDREFSNLNEEEFDLFLEESMGNPPASLDGSITPWRKSMNRILWGIGLTMMTLNFLALDVILPAIGWILLVLGLRALRRENPWFRAAYIACWVRIVWWLFAFTANLSVAVGPGLQQILAVGPYIMLIPDLITVLGIRNGIREVQQKAGLPPHGGNGLLVWYVILAAFALVNYSGILGWGFLIAYPFLLHSLYKLSKELDEAGYSMEPSIPRISDLAIKIGYGAAIGICLIIGYGFLNQYPMDWQPAEPVRADGVRQELEDLGFPGYVLDDMTEEEILSCQGAKFVLVKTSTGMNAEKVIADTSGTGTPLQFTNIALQFPGGRERWRIICHFRWQVDPGFCGTEAMQIRPVAEQEGWTVDGDFRGRVLYDQEGKTQASPYYNLGWKTYKNEDPLSVILGQATSTEVFATFSFPADAHNARGYVFYDALALEDPWLIPSWFNYVHQYSPFQHPVQTAMEFRQTHSGHDNQQFYSIYNYFLVRPNEAPEPDK